MEDIMMYGEDSGYEYRAGPINLSGREFPKPFSERWVMTAIEACLALYDRLENKLLIPSGWSVVGSFDIERLEMRDGYHEDVGGGDFAKVAAILKRDKTSDYMLVMRGADHPREMMTQMGWTKTQFVPFATDRPLEGNIVNGSYNYYRAFRQPMLEKLREIYRTGGISSLAIFGHCLGSVNGHCAIVDIINDPEFTDSSSEHFLKFPVTMLGVSVIRSSDAIFRDHYLRCVDRSKGYLQNLSLTNTNDFVANFLPPITWCARWPDMYRVEFSKLSEGTVAHRLVGYKGAIEMMLESGHVVLGDKDFWTDPE